MVSDMIRLKRTLKPADLKDLNQTDRAHLMEVLDLMQSRSSSVSSVSSCGSCVSTLSIASSQRTASTADCNLDTLVKSGVVDIHICIIINSMHAQCIPM